MTNRSAISLYSLLALVAVVGLGLTVQSAAAAEKPLRVCADPDYMPYSDQAGQGYENKIAELMAKAMGRKLEYHWASQRQEGGFGNFLALNLDKGLCDVVMDIPYGDPEELYTNSYYSSSYVFIYKKSKHYDITSMDSPQLKHVKVGYELDTPPQTGLKLRGLLNTAVQFHIAEKPHVSPKTMLEAVERGKVDVMITWEPAVGYYMHEFPGLKMVRVPNTRSTGSPEEYLFTMAMAVRKGDHSLKDELDKAIASHKAQIQQILENYNVKLLPSANGSLYYGNGNM